MIRQTFKKGERLISKKIIEMLMSRGKTYPSSQYKKILGIPVEKADRSPDGQKKTEQQGYFPFRLLWMETELPGTYPAQVLFSVPKKKFKSAVQRNRIKRRMREAYRKNKHLLYEELKRSGKKMALAFIYTSPAESEYIEIEQKIILSLHIASGADSLPADKD